MLTTGIFRVKASEREPTTVNIEESRHRSCSGGWCIDADGNVGCARRAWDAVVVNRHPLVLGPLSRSSCEHLCHPLAGCNWIARNAAEERLHLDEACAQFGVHGCFILFDVHGVPLCR